jgi:hypothetical protein
MKPEFQIPKNTIETKAAIDIASTPEHVASVYCDVEKWGEKFPATIDYARVIKSGDNWKQHEGLRPGPAQDRR